MFYRAKIRFDRKSYGSGSLPRSVMCLGHIRFESNQIGYRAPVFHVSVPSSAPHQCANVNILRPRTLAASSTSFSQLYTILSLYTRVRITFMYV